jgi:hypothetical protein
MGVPTSEVGYTSATARRGDHESSYENVVALKKKNLPYGKIMLRNWTSRSTWFIWYTDSIYLPYTLQSLVWEVPVSVPAPVTCYGDRLFVVSSVPVTKPDALSKTGLLRIASFQNFRFIVYCLLHSSAKCNPS